MPLSFGTKIWSFEALSYETWIAAFATTGLVGYLAARYLLGVPENGSRWSLIAVLLVGGGPLVAGLARRIIARDFGSDILAGLSIVTSATLGEYLGRIHRRPYAVGRCRAGTIRHAQGLRGIGGAREETAAHCPQAH